MTNILAMEFSPGTYEITDESVPVYRRQDEYTNSVAKMIQRKHTNGDKIEVLEVTKPDQDQNSKLIRGILKGGVWMTLRTKSGHHTVRKVSYVDHVHVVGECHSNLLAIESRNMYRKYAENGYLNYFAEGNTPNLITTKDEKKSKYEMSLESIFSYFTAAILLIISTEIELSHDRYPYMSIKMQNQLTTRGENYCIDIHKILTIDELTNFKMFQRKVIRFTDLVENSTKYRNLLCKILQLLWEQWGVPLFDKLDETSKGTLQSSYNYVMDVVSIPTRESIQSIVNRACRFDWICLLDFRSELWADRVMYALKCNNYESEVPIVIQMGSKHSEYFSKRLQQKYKQQTGRELNVVMCEVNNWKCEDDMANIDFLFDHYFLQEKNYHENKNANLIFECMINNPTGKNYHAKTNFQLTPLNDI